MTVDSKRDVRTIERALIQIVHALGPHNLGRSTERALDGMVNLTHLTVVDCVDDGDEKPHVTIGAIARHAGVDPSRASRLVRSTLRAGYVERVIAQADARKTYVILTPKGRKFAAGIKMIRRRYFASLVKGWSDKDSNELARLLTRLAFAGREHKGEEKPSKIAKGRRTNIIKHPAFELLKKA
jgi:DNA-binding MarR family transcriptional regulator